jgi:16S rRNA G966 N2-methylase RsmD
MNERLQNFERALVGTIESDRAPLDSISGIHKYWARKPWRVLDYFIAKYSHPGDLILDPFAGSGSTGLQANLEGRRFIGIDLNPFACFLTDQTLSTNFDDLQLELDLNNLSSSVGNRIMELYNVDDDRYALWSTIDVETGRLRGMTGDRQFGSKRKGEFVLPTVDEIRVSTSMPDKDFPDKFFKDRFSYKGVRKVSDLFTRRNLIALEILWSAIEDLELSQRLSLKLAFSNTLLHVSKLKSEGVRPLGVNNYWIPDDHIEENVWWRFLDRTAKLRRSKASLIAERRSRPKAISDYKVLNKSSLHIPEISDESVDYIFADPPYGDAIQYSELSFVWNTWLGFSYAIDEEIIVNPVQNKKNAEYLGLLSASLNEAHRVLKINAFATIAFHTRDLNLWLGLAEILGSTGFSLQTVNAFPPKGNPFTRNWAKFSPKTDIYITVRKHSVSKSLPKKSLEFTEVSSEIQKYIGEREITLGLKYDLLVASLFEYRMRGYEIVGIPKKRSLEAMVAAVGG